MPTKTGRNISAQGVQPCFHRECDTMFLQIRLNMGTMIGFSAKRGSARRALNEIESVSGVICRRMESMLEQRVKDEKFDVAIAGHDPPRKIAFDVVLLLWKEMMNVLGDELKAVAENAK